MAMTMDVYTYDGNDYGHTCLNSQTVDLALRILRVWSGRDMDNIFTWA